MTSSESTGSGALSASYVKFADFMYFRVAPLKSTLVRFALLKFTLVRFALVNFTFVRFTPEKFVPVRSSPDSIDHFVEID